MWERINILMHTGRHAEAETEIRRQIGQDPENALLHSWLAIALSAQQNYPEARREAEYAVTRDPDNDFCHYALAEVSEDMDDHPRAVQAITEAIRLEPMDPDYWGLLARIHAVRQRWETCLETAENGLSFNPEHESCNNYRVMALVKLGREQEAGDGMDAVLAQHPESSFSHATTAWTKLEHGDRDASLRHFSEALRLDPNNEWARHGILTAIKSKNPFYRLMLDWTFWMLKFDAGTRNKILGGMFLLYIFSDAIIAAAPLSRYIVLPAQWIYITFALATWLADPLLNLLLLFNRFGRRAMTDAQRRAAMVFGLILLITLPAAASWAIQGGQTPRIVTYFGLGMMMCLAAVNVGLNTGRWLFQVTYMAILAVIGLVMVYTEITGNPWREAWWMWYLFALIGFQIMFVFAREHVSQLQQANYLRRRFAIMTAVLLLTGWMARSLFPPEILTEEQIDAVLDGRIKMHERSPVEPPE